MRILVIQLRQLGDILLTTPCIREIRKHYGKDAHISFLSHRMGKLVLEGNPDLNEFYYYDETEGWSAALKLAKILRQKKFDLAFDFMNNPRSAIFALGCRAKQRFAFHSVRRFAYTNTIPRHAGSDYIVREKFRLLAAAGIPTGDVSLVLPLQEYHTAVAHRFFATQPVFKSATLKVIISPTHRRIDRQWPLIRYAELSDRLVREWGAAVTWLWGPGEEEFVKSGLYLTSEPALLAPKTSFREMAALVQLHDLFIGNSNGPSHVAVAVDTCSLQLHGPTPSKSWCPLTERHRAIQSKESIGAASMAAIATADVWNELQAMRPGLR